MKPVLVIDQAGPEGDVFQMVTEAEHALREAGMPEAREELRKRFTEMTTPVDRAEMPYQEVKNLIEDYCTVTWCLWQ